MSAFLATATVTLASIQNLPPSEAGALVLEGRAHGPIEQVVRRIDAMAPPGFVDYEFVERPVAVDDGCVRQRFLVSFQQTSDEPQSSALLGSVYPTSEIALQYRRACPPAGYAKINGSLQPSAAIAALISFERIKVDHPGRSFACTDHTHSQICRSDRNVRHELRRLPVWAVMRQRTSLVFWLGNAGPTVTEVSFDAGKPDPIVVDRRIPPPF